MMLYWTVHRESQGVVGLISDHCFSIINAASREGFSPANQP
jgi:hypothetical protein